jgi:hypothetical protein
MTKWGRNRMNVLWQGRTAYAPAFFITFKKNYLLLYNNLKQYDKN